MASNDTGSRDDFDRPRLALSLPNMAEPDRLVDLGTRAEARGWQGVFLWDHVHGSPDMLVPISDPWIVLGVLAQRTTQITLGSGITPVARRQPRELARQSVTVDHLSGGRLVLGVGLGEPPDEYLAYGERADPQHLAGRLDEGLEVIAGLWSGERVDHAGEHFSVAGAQYLPTPVQRPRIPVWAGCTIPHTQPLRRAARWDGVILAAVTETGGIEAVPPDEVRRAKEVVARHRDPDAAALTIAVSHDGIPSEDRLATYAEVGVSWVLVTGWIDELDEIVDA